MRPLREAHAHLFMLGQSLSLLALGDCRCVDECLDRVRAEAASMRDQPVRWLLGCAMRVEGWTDPRWPTRVELDKACPDRPAVLMSFDHHSVAANSRAMAAAGLHDDASDPPGGVIKRDRAGVPTGVLLESAAKRVWHAAPEVPEHERPAVVARGVSHLRSLGYTQVHDLLSPSWLGGILARMSDRGELGMSVGLYPIMDELDAQVRAAESYTRADVRLMGAKVFADGTLNSRTAWMLEPYADGMKDHPRGTPLMHEPALRTAMEHAASHALGLAVHAIGDAAARATLNAWEASRSARRSREVPALRIEHCEVIDENDVPRLAALGVIASVQPCHLLADIDVLRRALPHTLDRVLPLRALIDSGCVPGRSLLFGSDVPIVGADPADSLVAATHRRRVGMHQGDALGWAQRITEEEAWAAFTPAPLA